MNKNIDDAPYYEHLILYMLDGSIHSGIRTKGQFVQWPGTSKETHTQYSYFVPLGISATYDADAYFESVVIGWDKMAVNP